MAMDAYKKAADGGNCVAMLEIGELYSKGNGVPIDKASAQSWQARAQSCGGGNLASLQQQISQYRARAAAARVPLLDAIPVIPNSAPVAARKGNRSGDTFESKFLAAAAAGLVIVGALSVLFPNSPAPEDIRQTDCFTIPTAGHVMPGFPQWTNGATATVRNHGVSSSRKSTSSNNGIGSVRIWKSRRPSAVTGFDSASAQKR